jgi:hypothetical protein
MEETQVKHYKNLIAKNLSRNLPKKIKNPEIKKTIAIIIKRTEFYMKNHTNNFYPEKYTISVDEIHPGLIFINIIFHNGDISRKLIFLETGKLFGVKHFDRNNPYRFTYGLSDKSVDTINFKTDLNRGNIMKKVIKI